MFGIFKRGGGEDSDKSSGGDKSTREVAKPAKEGDKCKLCGDSFSIINLKHACRKCGNIVCGSCSTGKMYVRGHQENVRVCDDCMEEKMQARGKTFTSPGLEKRKRLKEMEEKMKRGEEEGEKKGTKSSKGGSVDFSLIDAFKTKGWTGWEDESVKAGRWRTKKTGGAVMSGEATQLSPRKKVAKVDEGSTSASVEKARKPMKMEDKDFASDLQELGWEEHEEHPVAAPGGVQREQAAPLTGNLGRLQAEILDLKRSALAFRKQGRKAEAMEALKKAKVKEMELQELKMIGADEDDDEEEDPELVEAMAVAEMEMKNRPKGGGDVNPAELMKVLADMGEGDVEVSDDSDVDDETAGDLQSLGWEGGAAGGGGRKKAPRPKARSKAGGSMAVPGGEKDLLAAAMHAIGNENDDVEVTDGDLENPEWLSELGELGWQQDEGAAAASPLPRVPPAQQAAPGGQRGKSKAELEKEIKAVKLRALKLRKANMMEEWKEQAALIMQLEEQLQKASEDPAVTAQPRQESRQRIPVPMEESVAPTGSGRPAAVPAKSKAEIEKELKTVKLRALKLRKAGQMDEWREQAALIVQLEDQLQKAADSQAVVASPPQAVRERIPAPVEVIDVPAVQQRPQSVPAKSKAELEKEIMALKLNALKLRKAGKMEEWREQASLISELEEQLQKAAEAPAVSAQPPQPIRERVPAPMMASSGAQQHVPVAMSPSSERSAAVPIKSKAELEKEVKALKLNALKLRKANRMEEWREQAQVIMELEEQLQKLSQAPDVAAQPAHAVRERMPAPLETAAPPRPGRGGEGGVQGKVGMSPTVRSERVDNEDDDSDDFNRRLQKLKQTQQTSQPPASSRLGFEEQRGTDPPALPRTAASKPAVNVDALEKQLQSMKKEALLLFKAKRMDEWRESAAKIKELQEEIEAAKAGSTSGGSGGNAPAPLFSSQPEAVRQVESRRDERVADVGGRVADTRRTPSVDVSDVRRGEIAELKRQALALKNEGRKDEALDLLRRAKQLELELSGATGAEALSKQPAGAAVRGAGIESVSPSGGGKGAKPSVGNDKGRATGLAGGDKQQRRQLELRIRAERLKVASLMQLGRTEEARQAHTLVKSLEQELKSLG